MGKKSGAGDPRIIFSFEDAWKAHDQSELDRINAEGRRRELDTIKGLVMFRLGEALQLSATTSALVSYPGCSVQRRDAIINNELERFANFALDNHKGHEDDFNLARDDVRDRLLRGLNARIMTALETEGAKFVRPTLVRVDEEVRSPADTHLEQALRVIGQGRHTLGVVSQRMQSEDDGMARSKGGKSKPVRPDGDGPSPKSAG